MDTLRETARVVTSKPVQRAIVNSALLGISTITLFGFAAVASALFFHSFVPDKSITAPLYLQYGLTAHPYAVATISPPRPKTQQEYDISVSLSMPKSPANTERGNFMVSLHLINAGGKGSVVDSAHSFAKERGDFGTRKILFSSRRPALVPYIDPVVSLASRVIFLAYHVLFPASQTLTMIVPLAERVEFFKESLIPAAAYVEVEAGQDIQIYKAELTLTAQLRGLRWLMFHYRLITYTAFTVLFWLCELLFMSVAWAAWVSFTGPTDDGVQEKGKRRAIEGGDGHSGSDEYDEYGDEYEEDSDTSDRLHSSSSQRMALKFKKEASVKDEEEQYKPLSEIPLASPGIEADDEDGFEEEDDDRKHGISAGLGTGYNEQGSEQIRRRASQNAL